MKRIAAALLLSTAVAAPAFADGNGWYAGVTVGTARTGTPNGATLSSSSETVGSILGGYQFTKNWGAEAEYTGAGKFADNSGDSAKADAWSLKAVGTLPLSDTFGLYGKLGYASTKTSTSGLNITGATRSAATYGLGLKYAATSSVDIRFGWDRYGAAINSPGTNNYNTNVYSLGAVYKF